MLSEGKGDKTRGRERQLCRAQRSPETELDTGCQASGGGNSPGLMPQAGIGRLKKHPNSAGERDVGLYRYSLQPAGLNPGSE